tara:strand:- start:79 stop:393 length:315 start_codon:yes stop_codon:yes gene_type:complete
MLEKLSNKIIAIGGAVVVIGGFIAYLGFQIQTPTQTLDKHLAQEEKTHTAFDIKLDSAAKSVEHVEHVEELLEGMLRGECLENPKENLARQGLLKKCEELGIVR